MMIYVSQNACSMFHVLGNGTVEQNQFHETKRGTANGTSIQKSLLSKGLSGFPAEHREEHPWNKCPKRVPRPLSSWNKKLRFNKKENDHGF